MSRRETVLFPPPRASGADVGPSGPNRGLRGLAVAATAATFLLVAVGALVRATNSGDACPDWPRCNGRWIPPLEYHQLIEYSHRLIASVVIVLIAVLAVLAWRRRDSAPRVFRAAALAMGLVLAQALLGAVVVWSGLDAFNVTAHLATAMLLVAALVYATVAAFSGGAPVAGAWSLPRLAWSVAAAAFLLMLAGAAVRGAGAGLVFPDWPLMDGRVVPGLGAVEPAVHFAHRALALAVGVLVAWLAVRVRRDPSAAQVIVTLATTAAGLYIAQALTGAVNVWSRLAMVPTIAHVTLGSMLWGTLVAIAAVASLRPRASVGGATNTRGPNP